MIATHFPVPRREADEVGLEIELATMEVLAAIRYPLTISGRMILKGDFAALVPGARPTSNYIQWHLYCIPVVERKLMGEQGRRLGVAHIHVDDSYPTPTLNYMEASGAFIGYNGDVRIHLESQDSGHEVLQPSGSPKEGKWVAISKEVSPTVGNSHVATANLAAKATFRKGLQANVKISKIRVSDLLRHAKDTPALICGINPDLRCTAALVPEICIVLELAYAWASLQPDKEIIMKNVSFTAPA